MGFFELLLIAVGLSMDAFAVSLCRGLYMRKLRARACFIVALFFGGFQAAMPMLGWLLGRQFERYITGVDHWLAFGLLGLIGGKMIYEVFKTDDCPAGEADELKIRELFMLAVATSIDALAVGITFAFLSVPIVYSAALIGAVTFTLSLAGVVVGHWFGARWKKKAEFAGGAVLILIGAKILFEHLGVFQGLS